MINTALEVQRGTSLVFSVEVMDPVTGLDYDLTQANVTAKLTVAKARGSTPPIFQKAYTSATPHAATGLALGATNGQLVATIAPADTTALTADSKLAWDLLVTQPSGETDVVARGTLLVVRGAGS